MDNTALNVVCNQEYAQAVPHVCEHLTLRKGEHKSDRDLNLQVHYHIVPAPTETTSVAVPSPSAPLSKTEMHRREFLARDELDDDDAEVIVRKIRSKL
jgi:hypothetical protein